MKGSEGKKTLGCHITAPPKTHSNEHNSLAPLMVIINTQSIDHNAHVRARA